MIRHRDVEQLQQLSQAPGKTLTVYLDVDQTNAANRKRQFETRLKDMLRQLRADHPDDDELPGTGRGGRGHRQAHRARGKTLVLARHRRLGVTFRKILQGPAAVRRATGAPAPSCDRSSRRSTSTSASASCSSTSKRARLFTVFLGEIEEHKDLISEMPPRPDSPTSDKLRSQSRMERHHDESVTLAPRAWSRPRSAACSTSSRSTA